MTLIYLALSILPLLALFAIVFGLVYLSARTPRAYASSTSAIAGAIAVEGMQIKFGNGASPEVFTTVCNVSDITLPLTADVVDITNVGDMWRRRISTLLDMGKIKFKVFWVMTEPTH